MNEPAYRDPEDRTSARAWTVGHSTHSVELFLQIARAAGIEIIADVRSVPRSTFAKQFNGESLASLLPNAGLQYVFMGDELGGRPHGIGMYDSTGRAIYSAVAETPAFRNGLARLLDGVERYRVAIMCAEESPVDCHRRLLVGRELRDLGVVVCHLRGDGRIQTEEDLLAEDALQHPERVQLGLFWKEESDWKSSRSVSQSTLLNNSSKRSKRTE
jgi:uncharacterized protein (DUF488 family)